MDCLLIVSLAFLKLEFFQRFPLRSSLSGLFGSTFAAVGMFVYAPDHLLVTARFALRARGVYPPDGKLQMQVFVYMLCHIEMAFPMRNDEYILRFFANLFAKLNIQALAVVYGVCIIPEAAVAIQLNTAPEQKVEYQHVRALFQHQFELYLTLLQYGTGEAFEKILPDSHIETVNAVRKAHKTNVVFLK